MNRDEIMALANQTAGQHWMDEAHIQRFAALVAAAEREAIADELEHGFEDGNGFHAIYARAIRERSNP